MRKHSARLDDQSYLPIHGPTSSLFCCLASPNTSAQLSSEELNGSMGKSCSGICKDWISFSKKIVKTQFADDRSLPCLSHHIGRVSCFQSILFKGFTQSGGIHKTKRKNQMSEATNQELSQYFIVFLVTFPLILGKSWQGPFFNCWKAIVMVAFHPDLPHTRGRPRTAPLRGRTAWRVRLWRNITFLYHNGSPKSPKQCIVGQRH